MADDHVYTRFCFGRKKKVRKIATTSDKEFIEQQVLQLFPELAKIQYEAFYKEYLIEDAEDLESAVEEYKSTNPASQFWFDIEIKDPNAPAPPPRRAPAPKRVAAPPIPVVTAPVVTAPVVTAPAVTAPTPVPQQSAPPPQQSAPPPQQQPAAANPYGTQQAPYAPHKHLGQMTTDQRVLHKLVWGLSHGGWMRIMDLRKKLPGKKKPNKKLMESLMHKGLGFGYFRRNTIRV